ncbi:hypothetical protein B6N60_00971 [Richelia sinica FACHB-800]|uniref:Uncharacterized protein n=1 Tax=Richelia sinica FACHB-800 TaxID=1357546 RepID=A0A975Y3M5_9NOST|nr:hypothetical protein B6N60_00971 [Richelia sinica FACHB-800]
MRKWGGYYTLNPFLHSHLSPTSSQPQGSNQGFTEL